jgi:hypothetical protein
VQENLSLFYQDAEPLDSRAGNGQRASPKLCTDPEQCLRTVTRRTNSHADEARLQNQLEALREEVHIKPSSSVFDLLGASRRRMLWAMADGEDEPSGSGRYGRSALARDASTVGLVPGDCAEPQPTYWRLLKMFLKEFELIEHQNRQLDQELEDCSADRKMPA